MEMVNIKKKIFGKELKGQFESNFAGVITKTEMGNVVVAVCELMGIDLRPPVGNHSFCHLDPIVSDQILILSLLKVSCGLAISLWWLWTA